MFVLWTNMLDMNTKVVGTKMSSLTIWPSTCHFPPSWYNHPKAVMPSFKTPFKIWLSLMMLAVLPALPRSPTIPLAIEIACLSSWARWLVTLLLLECIRPPPRISSSTSPVAALMNGGPAKKIWPWFCTMKFLSAIVGTYAPLERAELTQRLWRHRWNGGIELRIYKHNATCVPTCVMTLKHLSRTPNTRDGVCICQDAILHHLPNINVTIYHENKIATKIACTTPIWGIPRADIWAYISS